MLHLVEHLNVYQVVGLAQRIEHLGKRVLHIVLIGELEDGLLYLVAEPDDSLADELVGPLA